MRLLGEAGEPNLLVGTNCTLQVSSDGGATWQFVPTTSGFDVRVAASRERTVAGEIVAIGTSEGGTSFLWKFDLSSPDAVVDLGELATFWGLGGVAWREERMVLATAIGVGVSDDSGETWTWSRTGLEDATYSVDPLTDDIPAAEVGRTGGFRLAAVDPSDPDRIWVAGEPGLFRSDDGGATWTRLGNIANVDGLAVSTTSERVFAIANDHAYVWTLDGR
jgi:photosystem II stability/assembly factor-like uncharacterized protein